mmetsp:Transcript_23835/g.46391  ORF Transcript_23835/g.46391 Transcript_23835/m.46391 type:complete len:210 (+) Transcript_23835:1468-2097(+)
MGRRRRLRLHDAQPHLVHHGPRHQGVQGHARGRRQHGCLLVPRRQRGREWRESAPGTKRDPQRLWRRHLLVERCRDACRGEPHPLQHGLGRRHQLGRRRGANHRQLRLRQRQVGRALRHLPSPAGCAERQHDARAKRRRRRAGSAPAPQGARAHAHAHALRARGAASRRLRRLAVHGDLGGCTGARETQRPREHFEKGATGRLGAAGSK